MVMIMMVNSHLRLALPLRSNILSYSMSMRDDIIVLVLVLVFGIVWYALVCVGVGFCFVELR